MADDSKEEKLGIRNCEKGPRIRKPVPPPEEEVLLESLRGVLMAYGGVQMRSLTLVVTGLVQGGYIFYAVGGIAGVSCRRRWPRPLLLS